MSKKKKSKIAKKIQATKKFAGMALSSRTQSKHNGKNMGGPTTVVNITQGTSSGTKNFGTKQFQKLQPKQKQNQQQQHKKVQQAQPRNGKDDDFRMQMKSSQERAERNEEQHQERKQQQQQRQRTNILLQMAPASFVIDDKLKSTQRLVQEATQKMEMTQFVLGSTATMPISSDLHMRTTSLSSFTTAANNFQPRQDHIAAPPPRLSTIQSNPQQFQQQQQQQQALHRWTENDTSLHHDDNDNDDNPYTILHQQYDSDDDDNDDGVQRIDSNTMGTGRNQRRTQPIPTLQFAPPSFQVSEATSHHHSSYQFFDPDL
jgi:hypothetical protein